MNIKRSILLYNIQIQMVGKYIKKNKLLEHIYTYVANNSKNLINILINI